MENYVSLGINEICNGGMGERRSVKNYVPLHINKIGYGERWRRSVENFVPCTRHK